MIDNLIRAATCRVSCGDKSGTGHLVTEHNILTARHCVIPAIESDTPIELIFGGSEGDITLTASIVAHSEELDACILFISEQLERQPISMNSAMPREGVDWRSFGYPMAKTFIGHRIVGTISHVLNVPKLKMDIDLTVDPSNELSDYRGLSGAAVVCEDASRGMIRLKADKTIGAISHQQLEGFLVENGIQVPNQDTGMAKSVERKNSLANRSEFQETFEQIISGNPGDYVFLEGAHGIGKTTFCSEFEPDDQTLFCLGTYSLTLQARGSGASYGAQPEIFFDWLLSTVSTLINGKPSRKNELNYPKIVQQTSKLLDTFSDYCASINRHGILFLDALNEAQTADPSALAKLIGLLPQSLPKKVTVVLTAPNYHVVAGPLSGRVKGDNIISLPPLSDEASEAYCWQILAEDRATPALVALIREKAQGHPLYLRYMIEYANSNTEAGELTDFPILYGPIEEYYEALWARLIEDTNAINFLAVMARLRWGIRIDDFLKVLNPGEQAVFIPTITKIRHLLLHPEETTIYHPSFSDFLVSKTASLETVVQKRLAEFCNKETHLEYCVLNSVFHLLRSDDADRSTAFVGCSQDWVDKCVELGVEPSTLLFDIEATVRAAAKFAPAIEVIRLLLISQRVSFRYNTLFAQSALLIAEALIALGRPQEALKHAIRYNNLIVDPDEALQIALRLIQSQYLEEALELLRLLYQRILEAYARDSFELQGFIRLCTLHTRTILFMRLAEGGGRMRQVIAVVRHASRALEAALINDPPELLEECLVQVKCVPTSYFLCFHDTYASLPHLKKMVPDAEAPSDALSGIIWALHECEESIEKYNLSNQIASLSQVFSDIEDLLTAGQSFDKELVPVVVDTLVRFGSPSSVVQLVADKAEKLSPQPLKIKADNGVDVDFRSIHLGASKWRVMAFLGSDFDCPIVGAFHATGWLSTLDQLIRALFWCEGKARRAKADGNESQHLQSLESLKSRVLKPLAFTLAQRVQWQDSYAIPENVFPLVYERITVIMMDCYPKELTTFLQDLSKRVVDQCGLYTEGFRDLMFAVFRKLTVREIDASLFNEAFRLLQNLKEHVIRGVENRHELVPELLKLIPLYVKLGATEEAEGLYRHMLSVSMGPSWYKEDQLGLMISALRKMPPSDNIHTALPLIAGYLERASGEMTFQRYIRFQKQSLLAELFRRGKFASGCRYFKRQICGTTVELLSECQQGFIDKPSPMVGMRHPGGALDEQEAILKMVQNAYGIDWRLRWALLEIFQCGDERHLDDYASEYAKIINQAGSDKTTISEMIKRAEFVVGAEIEPEEQSRFLDSFRRKLDTANHEAFVDIAPQVSDADSLSKVSESVADAETVATNSDDVDKDDNDKLYMPGTFGRRSSSRESDAELAIAETHLQLGNLKAAKNQAAKVLSILQNGGWSIWGNLSETSNRAEAILREGAASAAEIIRFYAPLLEAERHIQKWVLAEHLIEKVGDLLQEDERSQLLQYVIDHVALMVGDASNESTIFRFLSEEPPSNGSLELFRLILWFLEHPQSLRREKAAGMVAWLVETEPVYFGESARHVFSMEPGYCADILCGILDNMSARDPKNLWDRLFELLDLETIIRDCKHAGRLIVLLRLAERAGITGSKSGLEVASRLLEHFRLGSIELGCDMFFDLPAWAKCISTEWKKLHKHGVTSKELLINVEQNLALLCLPLGVNDGKSLEDAVCASFREEKTRRFSRWEAKVRFALNTAILPYITKQNFREIELALRIYNPSLPELTLTPGFSSPADVAINAILTKNYAGAIGDSSSYFLNYHEVAKSDEDGNWVYIEVLAVIVPTSYVTRQPSPPSVPTSFSSRQLQNFSSASAVHETCCHLDPDFAFFGSLTPAFPLSAFKDLIKAKESDFSRINWRNGRSCDVRYCGRPVQEGCLLAVKRTAVHLPEGRKLAWIIRINGEFACMIDEQNNQLV